MRIDPKKLNTLKSASITIPGPNELRRAGNIFFVGANLTISDALETMFESFCMESTELFHLAFGSSDNFDKALEMARQIKKNFNARLLGSMDFLPSARHLELGYAAGVDLFTVPFQHIADAHPAAPDQTLAALTASDSILPHWSLIATIQLNQGNLEEIDKNIDRLLANGIVPLPLLNESAVSVSAEDLHNIYKHLISGLQQYRVPLKPLLALTSHLTPLVPDKNEGIVKAWISRFHDRHLRAAADLKRHLRIHAAEDSLDSAGL